MHATIGLMFGPVDVVLAAHEHAAPRSFAPLDWLTTALSPASGTDPHSDLPRGPQRAQLDFSIAKAAKAAQGRQRIFCGRTEHAAPCVAVHPSFLGGLALGGLGDPIRKMSKDDWRVRFVAKRPFW